MSRGAFQPLVAKHEYYNNKHLINDPDKKKNLPELRQIFLAKPFNHLFLIHEHRRQNKLHQTLKKYTSQGFHKKYSISIFPKLLTN